jgi:LacI family transcriptional regulator
MPVVLLERNLRGDNRPLDRDFVGPDDVDGGRRCTQHLIAQGCRRIACVTASPTSSHNDRVTGYLHALFMASSHGPAGAFAPRVLYQPTDLSSNETFSRLADRLLQEKSDGVVCYQDYVAVGLIVELLARGVRVPQDIAVVGFDNLPIGTMFAIGVTTYALPAEAVARQALRVLRARIQSPNEPPVKILVPGELIIRHSSAAIEPGGL